MKTKTKDKIPRIIIFMEGGIIHDVISDRKVKVRIVDYDIEGSTDYRMIRICGEPSLDRYAHISKYDLYGKEHKKDIRFFFKQGSIK